MPRSTPPIYKRGRFSLDWDRRADGSLRSPNLAIFWYDPDARRVRSTSTGTAEEDAAVLILDRRYLEDANEAPAFCHACGQPIAHGGSYLLTDAIADYRLEWGDQRASGSSIEARLKHVLDFLDAQEAAGARFGLATTCAVACTKAFLNAFRAWSRKEPITWRNKKGKVTVSRERSPAATEASVAQLAAALNHAVNADPPRSDKRPSWKPHARSQVQRVRRSRLTIEELARILAYAAEPERRYGSLHAFIVASICTMARPGAIVDINVAPGRKQWWKRDAGFLDLNPSGRVQNKKRRPYLPVIAPLGEWLAAELAIYEALPPDKREGRGWLVNYFGRGLKSVDRAWDTMLENLKLPVGREWRPYILRHSLATLARNHGAEKWDLEGFMGHRASSQTEVYAIGEFPSVQRALATIIYKLEQLAPGALHRTDTGASAPPSTGEETKMSG